MKDGAPGLFGGAPEGLTALRPAPGGRSLVSQFWRSRCFCAVVSVFNPKRIYVGGEIETIFAAWLGKLGRPSGLLAAMFLLNAIPD